MPFRQLFALLLLACAAAGLVGGCGDEATSPAAYSVIETFAGTGTPGMSADSLSARQSMLDFPQDIAFGPDGALYIADFNNNRIVAVKNNVLYQVVGDGTPGNVTTGPAANIQLSHPTGVAFAPNGALVIFAWENSKILSLDLATNLVTQIAGTEMSGFSGDGGPATQANLNHPLCGFFDDDGRLVFVDQWNSCIRRIENGTISTFAGVPMQSGYVDSVPSSEAKFDFLAPSPTGRIAIDAASAKMYVADTNNERIRIMEPVGPVPNALSPAHEDYLVRRFAGDGNIAFWGDGGPALQASFNYPADVDVDQEGSVYVADTNNHCIRKITPQGTISTFAGQPTYSHQDSIEVGDGGSPRDAYLAHPTGICFDAGGNMYIADSGHDRIRVIWKRPEAHQ